ncbi:hypothetical protein TREVI0001_0277 [Treponema vincentii ATCC 35580]|uniref:Uncharacterized protein n=1 Tax=Treponema vincentii ATCC 35580 TaxID=596324 RepID=C8PU34_9SPIR|nr:hypothetical protein TREVI0001_0277 [Treponema vincentii ATCC 35580]
MLLNIRRRELLQATEFLEMLRYKNLQLRKDVWSAILNRII